MMTRSNILNDSIFWHKWLCKYPRACCPDLSKIPVVTMGNSHIFAGDYKKLFLGLSQTVNRFCNFIVKRQRLKVIESREKTGPLWCWYTLNASKKSVQWKSNLFIIHSQFSHNMDVEFCGNVSHDVQKMYVDDIWGIDREELKDDFKKHLSTQPRQVYGERLNNISDGAFCIRKQGKCW